MRLAAIASALAIIICVAVVGVILSQSTSIAVPASAPKVVAPAARPPGPVVTEVPAAAAFNPADQAASAFAPAPNAPTTLAQAAPRAPAPAPAPAAAPPPPPPHVAAPAPASCPGNPNALGVSRTVEIDTTGGPGFGFEHFKSHDFLREGEVVLTFDDGPWPKNTVAVLNALAAHCTKAIFFPIGLHATYEPGLLKQVAAAGHAVGSHTWCHQDLSKTKGKCLINGKVQGVEYDPKEEIEKGISAVRWAVGGPTAPYFRFPALRQPPELITYLGQRNIAIFSTDFDSFDFKMRKPEQVVASVMAKLKKHGKGIVLLHDFQQSTAHAVGDLLAQLKAGGYKIVHMKTKDSLATIKQYDDMLIKEQKLPTVSQRPTSSVVRSLD
jgi:peptidoglycan/xylan/chitin deacetylase (PgdA/CDA1 family)